MVLVIILIIIVVLVISFIFFRRYFSALFLDYVVDGLGSFLDNLIGIGAIGLDIFDWVAALWIFRKTKNPLARVFSVPTNCSLWDRLPDRNPEKPRCGLS